MYTLTLLIHENVKFKLTTVIFYLVLLFSCFVCLSCLSNWNIRESKGSCLICCYSLAVWLPVWTHESSMYLIVDTKQWFSRVLDVMVCIFKNMCVCIYTYIL